MAQELVIMVGLQGAGKSRYCRHHFQGTHTYVSKDRLRNNRRPQRRQMCLIAEALGRGESVVVDNTHPSQGERQLLVQLARRFQVRVRAIFVDTPADLCQQRNEARSEKERVPLIGVYATRKIFEIPTLEEGFTEVLVIRGEL